MEVCEKGRVEDVILGYPRPLFWAASLPVDEIFQTATSTSGVQNFKDNIDWFFIDLRYRGHVIRARLCGGNRNRWTVRFQQGHMKSRVNFVVRRKLEGAQFPAGQAQANVPCRGLCPLRYQNCEIHD